jgi:D-alanyl-D-alanine carboxypeptidase/D-alanyl-D-alanine-endopeptidase (penicillin-binding protein 4)
VAKLPTALYALATLGAEHRFETRLAAAGPVRDGALEGDLVLEGGGDPELDTDRLARLVEALEAAGVRRVAGEFLVDGSALPRVAEIDPGQPVDVAYNPSVSGLNLNFNRVFLRWGRQAGPEGLAVTARGERLDPAVGHVRVESEARRRPLFRHAGAEDGEVWSLARALLSGEGARWLPVRLPELYAGDVFRRLARTRGIELPAPRQGRAGEGARVLARLPSRPLGVIVADMMRFSTNLTAEVVGTAAARASGMAPETLAQSAAMMNAWVARMAGSSPGDPRIRFVNHSGLTTESRVAPSRIARLLAAAARRRTGASAAAPGLPGPAALLLDDYSVAVESEPLDYDRLVIRAKTGTMDRIRGLAGYVLTPKGRRLTFAIFSNALAEREAGRRGIARGWMRRARAFERALIRSWVRRFDRATETALSR